MEAQNSYIQSFRHSFNRTKSLSLKLNAQLKKNVENSLPFEKYLSELINDPKEFSTNPKIYDEKNNNFFKNSEIDEKTEELFQFTIDERVSKHVKEAKLLVSEIDQPKSKIHQQSSAAQINSTKKTKKKKNLKMKKPYYDNSYLQKNLMDKNYYDDSDNKIINEQDKNDLSNQNRQQNVQNYDPLDPFMNQVKDYELISSKIKSKASQLPNDEFVSQKLSNNNKEKQYDPMNLINSPESEEKKNFLISQKDILDLQELSLPNTQLFESLIEGLIFTNRKPVYPLEEIGDVLFLDFDFMDQCKDNFSSYQNINSFMDPTTNTFEKEHNYNQILKWFFAKFEEVNKFTELPRFVIMGSRCAKRGLNPIMAVACNLSYDTNFSKYASFYERPVLFMLDPLHVVSDDEEIFFKRISLLVMEFFKNSGQDLEVEQPVAHQFIIP